MTDSAFGRLIGVFFAPTKTFQSIARRPTWFAPMLVMVLLGTAVAFLIAQRMDFAEAQRKAMEKKGMQVSEEQLDRQVTMVKKFAPYGALGFGLVGFPAVCLLLAAVFWVAFKTVGGEGSYLANLSAYLHGSLPGALVSLLSIPILLGRSALSADEMQRSGGVLLSSAAPFAPDGTGPALLSLLGSLDLFVFWCLALWAIGFQAANGVTRKLSVAVVVSLWVVYVAGKLGFAALFG